MENVEKGLGRKMRGLRIGGGPQVSSRGGAGIVLPMFALGAASASETDSSQERV